MARVVQRRGGPPYVLILLAFLFLASTTLAVLFYVSGEEKAKDLGEEKTKTSALAKENSKKASDIAGLVKKITGGSSSPKAATVEADQMLKDTETDYGSLSSAIAGLNNSIADLKSQIRSGRSASDDLEDKIVQKDKELGDLEQRLTEQLKTFDDKLVSEGKRYEEGLNRYKTEVEKANQEFKAILSQRDQRISALDAKLGDKAMEIRRLEAKNIQLERDYRDLKGEIGDAGEMLVTKPAGKIVRVFDNRGICYINLGERDRVTAGLPFSIFSSHTGVPKDGKPKAKIVIVNVGSTTSECRIVKASKGDPIIEGDLIVNLVFSSTRTYNFVVEGEFDLYGTGRPDPTANRHVRAMIERFGGKVDDKISISTDFVVMGNEPPRPPKPAEDAPPAVWKIYNEKKKTLDYYKKVEATAEKLQIPVLNTNRFLAYSGHVPKQRLID